MSWGPRRSPSQLELNVCKAYLVITQKHVTRVIEFLINVQTNRSNENRFGYLGTERDDEGNRFSFSESTALTPKIV